MRFECDEEGKLTCSINDHNASYNFVLNVYAYLYKIGFNGLLLRRTDFFCLNTDSFAFYTLSHNLQK